MAKAPQAAEAGADDPILHIAKTTTARGVVRYGSVYAAIGGGIVIAAIAFAFWRSDALVLGAIGFFTLYLATMLVRLPGLTPEVLRAHADESDVPGYVILVIALAALVAAIASLFGILNGTSKPDGFRLALGIAALGLGWLALNAMIGFHYAFEYYETNGDGAPNKAGDRPHRAGLDFPGKDLPDALSFLYFSFVVAMTAQVSDVDVTSNGMRRLVLFHGILAFVFNTVILATAVNIVVSLGKGG
jgi:uncharacterized membrane protein